MTEDMDQGALVMCPAGRVSDDAGTIHGTMIRLWNRNDSKEGPPDESTRCNQPMRKGLDTRSRPRVLAGPCPGWITVRSSRASSSLTRMLVNSTS